MTSTSTSTMTTTWDKISLKCNNSWDLGRFIISLKKKNSTQVQPQLLFKRMKTLQRNFFEIHRIKKYLPFKKRTLREFGETDFCFKLFFVVLSEIEEMFIHVWNATGCEWNELTVTYISFHFFLSLPLIHTNLYTHTHAHARTNTHSSSVPIMTFSILFQFFLNQFIFCFIMS